MVGLVGKKIGMTQVFDDIGNIMPVTVVHIMPNVVVGKRIMEKDGYSALILGAMDLKDKNVTKPYRGQFPEGIKPRKKCYEMKNFDKEYEIGAEISVSLFEGIDFVDIKGVSKGKGYQGVVKLHHFKGGRKTHGSKFHRAPGSTGQNTSPGHTFKGKRMPGRMGGNHMTVQNLRLVKIDTEKNSLLIQGALPGPRNCIVLVYKSKKKGNIKITREAPKE